MARVSFGELLEPYTYRRDFDYWKHLENRSHIDVLSDRVDQSILKLALSQEEIADLTAIRVGEQMRGVAESISAGQDRIVDELSSGFRDMSAGLDRVADSVDRVRDSVDEVRESVERVRVAIDQVRFTIENGFCITERRLASIEHVLSGLLEAIHSPERTWALEQYATARNLHRREFYQDALDYLDLAINGKGSSRGYRFDAQFHLLRGTILLGDRDNLDRALIDPCAAKAAFVEAVKYSKPPRDALDTADSSEQMKLLQPRCFALCCSGWASYVMGEMGEAERCYRAALGDCPDNARANFYLSKVLAREGRLEEAAVFFSKAIRINFYYIAQMAIDRDFSNDTSYFLDAVSDYRSELFSDLQPKVVALTKIASSPQSIAIVQSTSVWSNDLSNKISSFSKEIPIGPLAKIRPEINHLYESVRKGVSLVSNELRLELSRTEGEIRALGRSMDSIAALKRYNLEQRRLQCRNSLRWFERAYDTYFANQDTIKL